jgi:hypothetical protein
MQRVPEVETFFTLLSCSSKAGVAHDPGSAKDHMVVSLTEAGACDYIYSQRPQPCESESKSQGTSGIWGRWMRPLEPGINARFSPMTTWPHWISPPPNDTPPEKNARWTARVSILDYMQAVKRSLNARRSYRFETQVGAQHFSPTLPSRGM